MHRTVIAVALAATGFLLVLFSLAVSGSASASPHYHGTPDPNATPEVGSNVAAIENPTYYEHVEPILQANCMACHVEGSIGYSVFPMDDVAEITQSENANYIAFVTGIEYMPPWQLGDDSLPMQHERKLTDDEIALLARWAENGAPIGDEANRSTAAVEADVPQIRADLVLTMPEPYTPSGDLLDDYRCFLLDPGFETDTLVTGTDYIPGNTDIAHHAIFFIIDEAMVEEAESLSGADGRPGWQCFGGTGLETASQSGFAQLDQQELITALRDQGVDLQAVLASLNEYREDNPDSAVDFPALIDVLQAEGVDLERLIRDLDIDVAAMSGSGMSGSVGGWVPGSVPLLSPENTGLVVPANSQIVVQMHYNLYNTIGTDQSSMILQTAPLTDDVTPIRARSLVAPVEIPCPEGVDGPNCDREVSRFETVNPNTSDALLAACGQTLDTYADNTADNAYGFCDYPINFEGWILGLGPHMHELGKQSRVILNPDTPDELVLIDIPEWDFHWQGQYSFAEPVELQPGDVVRLECWWDNSNGERYVVWGEGTQDEMCFNFTRFLVREPGKTLADYGFEDHGAHSHEAMVEIGADAPIPSVEMTVTQTDSGGYFVELAVENFEFAPQSVDSAHVEGEGHAHLYVNGEKVTRLYGNAYYLDSLPTGEVEIRVTLNTNDHGVYAHHGVAIEDAVTLIVE